jgi:hypothetical protein
VKRFEVAVQGQLCQHAMLDPPDPLGVELELAANRGIALGLADIVEAEAQPDHRLTGLGDHGYGVEHAAALKLDVELLADLRALRRKNRAERRVRLAADGPVQARGHARRARLRGDLDGLQAAGCRQFLGRGLARHLRRQPALCR